jgi:hypothetical protein
MIDVGLAAMNIVFLRGQYHSSPKHYPAIPTTIAGRCQSKELVAVPEVR